jgi:hypothetical protein
MRYAALWPAQPPGRLAAAENGSHAADHVQPRIRNSTINIGIGIPSNQSNTHPAAPRSVLRIISPHFSQIYASKENVKKTLQKTGDV